MGIFSKGWWSKEAIAARKYRQKEESLERHKKLYPSKYKDEIKVVGGDASIAEEEAKGPRLISTEEKIIRYNKTHIANPLHEYNNFSPIITLIALTKEEVNFPYVLKDGGEGGKYCDCSNGR